MRSLVDLWFAGAICAGASLAQDRSLTPGTAAPGRPLSGPSSSGGVLHDNGGADGTGGYSNATIGVFGARRTLLDDFTVPAGESWGVSGLAWTHVWSQGHPPPFGTGAEFDFRDDAGGAPGAPFVTVSVTGYDEVPTGIVYFSRPEAASTATFDVLHLGEGTYWLDGTVVGADNNFWLTRTTVSGNECWVDYDDLGGLQPGTTVFGVASDLNFMLLGAPSDGGGCAIYDNGEADGVGGASNATDAVFGFRRTLLDDFTVPVGESWNLNRISWTHIWDSAPVGTGTSAEFDFRADAGSAPGGVFATALVTSYTEIASGAVFFSRPEAASTVTFDPIALPPGIYWLDGTVVGTDNNFWLIRSTVSGAEFWIDYDDLGGLQPGSGVFGEPADLNFELGVPAIGRNYCVAWPNSTGFTGVLQATGSEVVGDNYVLFLACHLPANQNGYLLNSRVPDSVPIGNGILCLGGGIGRHTGLIANSGPAGHIKSVIDLNALPRPTGGAHVVQPGETWYFTLWHRDGVESNFTDAVCITFQ